MTYEHNCKDRFLSIKELQHNYSTAQHRAQLYYLRHTCVLNFLQKRIKMLSSWKKHLKKTGIPWNLWWPAAATGEYELNNEVYYNFNIFDGRFLLHRIKR